MPDAGVASPPLDAASAAAPWTWRNVNLQGMGDVNGLILHPDTVHAPDLAYARTNVGGVYRRDPASPTWVPLLDAFGPLAANTYYVESVAVDPGQPDDVYIVVDGQTHYTPGCVVDPGQVLVSHDRGGTWTSTGPFGAYVFSNDPHGDTTGERLAVDPNKSGLLFFASHQDGLWRGSAGTWTNAVGAGLPSTSCSPECNLTCDASCSLACFAGDSFVVFDKAAGTTADGATRRLYVGVWTTGVFVSDDGGQTFTSIGADPHPVRGSVGPDGTLYVSFGQPEAPWAGPGGVRAYAPGSSGTWSDTDITPPPGTSVSYSGISADPNNAGTVVVTTNDAEIFRSTDRGATWTAIPITIASAPPWYWIPNWYQWGGALVVDPNDPRGATVWRTDGFAVSQTTDVTLGAWSAVMDGLEELVTAVVRTPGVAGGPQFYAGVADAVGFVDVDRTQPPPTNLDAPNGDVAMATSFDVCASQPRVAAFVGWDEETNPLTPVTGITTNGGASFAPFPNTDPGYGGVIAIASSDPTNLVWEPANGQPLVYTADGGRTWTPSALVTDAGMPGPSFYRSTQWFNGQTVAADRMAPGVFYYLSQSQGATPSIHFWSSTDGGRSFDDRGAPFEDAPLFTSSPMIKPNPSAAGDVWVTFGHADPQLGALYRSTDSGRTFARVASVGAAYQVAFGQGLSPGAPAVYLFGRLPGSSLDTMLLSDDLGGTWSAISDPTVNQFGEISYLEGDIAARGLVYVGLTGRGIVYGMP
jgi:xyloglucan-specific exo-beta-1,4-glucanase